MKKVIVWCLIVSVVLGTAGIRPVSAEELKDVPTDHWAYQAVSTLVNKGYMAVYEDGTFQGSRSVDRYTLAQTLARILDEIEAGRVNTSQDDVALLRELTTEFRDELVEWYATKDEMEEQLDTTLQTARVTEERLSRVVGAQVELQEEVAEIREELIKEAEYTRDSLSQQDAAIRENQAVIAQQKADLDEQMEEIKQLHDALVRLESLLLEHGTSIDGLENWAGEKGAVFAALQAEDARLAEEIKALVEEIEEVQAQLALTVDEQVADLDRNIEDIVATMARRDGQYVRELEEHKSRLNSLAERNKELEGDLQNLAVRLQREGQSRNELADSLRLEIAQLQEELALLETQVGLSEEELAALSRQISDEIGVEMNAALIREQRLERQLKELQDEFSSFKNASEQQSKSLKSQTTIAMVVAAVGIVIGFIGGN